MIISGIISIFLSGLYLGSKISYRLLSFLDHGTVRAILRNVISSQDCLLYPLDNVSNVPSGTNVARIHCITVYAGELPQFLIKISSTSSRSSLCVEDPTSILNLTPSSGHPESCIIKKRTLWDSKALDCRLDFCCSFCFFSTLSHKWIVRCEMELYIQLARIGRTLPTIKRPSYFRSYRLQSTDDFII